MLPPGSVLLSVRGVDDTLERLARSSRIDAVVTDDLGIVAVIRDEIPGALPVLLVAEGAEAAEVLRAVAETLGES